MIGAIISPVTVEQPNTMLDIRAYDIYGRPLTGMTSLVNVNYSGPVVPAQDSLVINEIMYNPAAPGASFIELYNKSANFAYNVSGWRINGIDYTFPPESLPERRTKT